MGVPAFFKWLTMRYPKLVIDAQLQDFNSKPRDKYLDNNTQPEVDNLYLDMNGIIHPCCHPQDRPTPQSLDEMFNDVFDYVDVLVNIIKPKKLIYMAIDGVAPRAKMNQQRSRRFRAALEAKETAEKEVELKQEWKKKGLKEIDDDLEKEKQNKFHFDSNTITPGTEFMEKLSDALEIYISHRLQFNPLWKDKLVIFSNANVPGEGEHKILDFIRHQRSQNDYSPNVSHCIYGADADLIMLSLITHEPNFTIIRESINDLTFRKCDICGKTGHSKLDCFKVTGKKEDIKTIQGIEFSIIKISVLREYLEIEFRDTNFPFTFDFERVIDDFIFLCFFVGNDFLPHLPSMKIREGGIDALLYLYKRLIPKLDGYLTDKGKINLKRTEFIFEKLALIENDFFATMIKFEEDNKRRREKYNNYKNNQTNSKSKQANLNPYNENGKLLSNFDKFKALNSKPIDDTKKVKNNEELDLVEDIPEESQDLKELKSIQGILDNVKNTKSKSKNCKEPDVTDLLKEDIEGNTEIFYEILKEKMRNERKEMEEKYEDPVVLGTSGWKERYYNNKFSVSADDKEFIKLIRTNYIEGLCWVFEYYYNGCVSWDWYYSFHYAPFISDLVDVKDLNIEFNMGEPFEPVEQLLAVLPPASSTALPKCLRRYMFEVDSEIIDFYPSYFALDINGQPFAWMGVNLIPFIEEDRIKAVVRKNKHKFVQSEKKRNSFGVCKLFCSAKFKNDISAIEDPTLSQDSNKNKSLVGFSFSEAPFSHKINEDLVNTTGLNRLKISVVKKCQIGSYKFEKSFLPNSSETNYRHTSDLKREVVFPNKVVFEDNLDAYKKKNYKGDVAINLVKNALATDGDYDVNEFEFMNQAYDRSNNNNRAVAYDPREVNFLKKKLARQQRMEENSNIPMNSNNMNMQGMNLQGINTQNMTLNPQQLFQLQQFHMQNMNMMQQQRMGGNYNPNMHNLNMMMNQQMLNLNSNQMNNNNCPNPQDINPNPYYDHNMYQNNNNINNNQNNYNNKRR